MNIKIARIVLTVVLGFVGFSNALASERNLAVKFKGVGTPFDATTVEFFDKLPPHVQENIMQAVACFKVPMYSLALNRQIGFGVILHRLCPLAIAAGFVGQHMIGEVEFEIVGQNAPRHRIHNQMMQGKHHF